MKEKITKLLKIAVNAPSGDNSQPWRFEFKEPELTIFNLPKKDNEIFNYQQRGSLIAHGALIQNILLLCPHFGFNPKVYFLPDPDNTNMTAKIIFDITSEQPNNDLIEKIVSRSTNRKKYRPYQLTQKEKSELLALNENSSLVNFIFTEEKPKLKKLGQAASLAEKTMLLYKPLHDVFFNMIRWNKNEEYKKMGGLKISTLELKPPQVLIFKWFNNWNASWILRLLGLPALIAKENAKIYASSSAIGAITANTLQPETFLKTGMLLQKIWLKITQLGLSMQPIAGVLYLGQRLKESQISDLQDDLKLQILSACSTISSEFNKNQNFLMLFRIGKSDPASAQSVKFIPEIKFKS